MRILRRMPVLVAVASAAVAIHSAGLAALDLALARRDVMGIRTFRIAARELVRASRALTALYFSGVTYGTIGYGDVVRPEPWRMPAPVEGLVGILMAGLSTGFFVAVVSRLYANAHAGHRLSGGGRPDPPR